MIELTDEQFQELIDQAFDELPKSHTDHFQNVAILYADEPSPAQREQLKLRHDQSLFGLYEGIPLAFRQGNTTTLPDRITLFKHPILSVCNNMAQVRDQIKRTLWHEIAHYFGLDHKQIAELEQ
jgi:predicted Zn-dependent protease with MMP-like domain